MSLESTSYPSLKRLQQVCLKQNIPFASYRQPLQSEITSLVQHLSFPEKFNSLLPAQHPGGFVIAPFHETEKQGSFILEPDAVFISDAVDPDFIQSLTGNSFFLSVARPAVNESVTTSREDFIEQVNDAKQAMNEGLFHKVVLSKIRVQELSDDFEASAFFLHLCDKYPHAFVYVIQLPEVGCWIGATPEPLLVVEEGRVKTVSLAGTQLATGIEIDAYGWSEKEIEEQGIVTGFVENTLKLLQIDKYLLNGPANYQAANLIHLKTTFEFEEAQLGKRFGDFLKALHPTPSVGGLPRQPALDFILNHEKYNRTYYTGFLGPLNMEAKSSLFVNLRCLQLFSHQFVLYSGAGITASSVAEREWEETDNKMMTMLNAMQLV